MEINVAFLALEACSDLLFKRDGGDINHTKFILRMGLARNNKPFLSNTSLVCHNYCNHIFPDVHKCPNIGLCLLVESPITWLTFTHCWLAQTSGRTNTSITPVSHVNIVCLKCQTHKRSLMWSKAKRGSGGGKEGAYHDWAARLRPAHVCVSSYSRNLLQALAWAATERWMACRIKARVVGKGVVERNSERERTIFRTRTKNQA